MSPVAITVGDFNGDGRLDLAVSNNSASAGNNVSVLLGNGDGTFKTQVQYAVGSNAFSIATGDFNGDGILDLAVANSGANSISILQGVGDGTFKGTSIVSAGTTPWTVSVADINGDGKADLVMADGGGNNVGVLGNGNGTFQNGQSYLLGRKCCPLWAAVGNFNGDGFPDVAVANSGTNTAGVLLNSVGETATATITGVSVPDRAARISRLPAIRATRISTPALRTWLPLTSSQVATTLALTAVPASSSTYGGSVTLTATLNPFAAEPFRPTPSDAFKMARPR